MTMKAAPRDLTPFLRFIRNRLLGRKYKNHLRYEGYMSARTQDAPWLPEGPSHKLAANYYVDRDARGEVTPPEVIYIARQKVPQLSSFGETPGPPKKAVVPGKGFNWKAGKA